MPYQHTLQPFVQGMQGLAGYLNQARMQKQQAREQAADKELYQNIMAQSTIRDPKTQKVVIDYGKAGTLAGRAGRHDWMTAFNEQAKKTADTQRASNIETREATEFQSKMEMQDLEKKYDILAGINNPMSYHKAMSEMWNIDKNFASKMPPKYNPQYISDITKQIERRVLPIEKQIQMELDKPGLSKAELEEKETQVKYADKLRGEFNNITKPFREVRDAYSRILSSVKDPSAAGDLSLIFNYMKVLDPGSVVRESEFQTADDARAWLSEMGQAGYVVPGFVVKAIQKAQTGQRLLPEQRRDFENRAKLLYGSALQGYRQNKDSYKTLAEQYGTKPEWVIVDYEMQANPEGKTKPVIKKESQLSLDEADELRKLEEKYGQ